MRTARPLLIAVCVALIGAVSLIAASASAQPEPREPRSRGGERPNNSGVQWLPGMNLEPTGTPERTTPPSPLSDRASATAATPVASSTSAPTLSPTPGPTVEPAPAEAPLRKSSGGPGLMPILSILGLALVTGPVLLFRRRRRDQPDASSLASLISEQKSTPDPEPVWEPEPIPSPEPIPDPEPVWEPDPVWETEPIPDPEPIPPAVEGSAGPPAQEAIVCENCGRENPAEHLFCDDCRQLLKWSES